MSDSSSSEDSIWKDPYSGDMMVDMAVLGQALRERVAQVTQIEEEYQRRLREGWLTHSEGAIQTNIPQVVLSTFVNKIEPNEYYTFTGEPLASTPVHGDCVKGEMLIWRHPEHDDIRLISPLLVNNIKLPESYLDLDTAVAQAGINKHAAWSRSKTYEANKYYTPEGLEPSEGTPFTVAGSDLARLLGGRMILRQSLVDAWKEAGLYSAALKAKGYEPITVVATRFAEKFQVNIEGRPPTIKPEDTYNEEGLPIDPSLPHKKGKELRWENPYSNEVLIAPSLIKAWDDAEVHVLELLAQKYKTIAEVAGSIGIEHGTLGARINQISPQTDYELFKNETSDEKVILKGEELFWKNPYSKIVYVNPILITHFARTAKELSRWETPAVKEDQLGESDYMDVITTAAFLGWKDKRVYEKFNTIKADKDYGLDGLPPKEGEPVVKGSHLITKAGWADHKPIIHKKLAEGWKSAEDHENKLRLEKYLTILEAAAYSELTKTLIKQRADGIVPTQNYAIDGTEASQTKEICKGNELAWKNPYNGEFFLRPSLVEGWKQAKLKEDVLLKDEYQTLPQAETTGIPYHILKHRVQKIEPNTKYNAEGLPPKEGEPSLTGNDLAWKNPYNDKTILLRPSLIRAWVAAAQKETDLVAKDYVTLKDAPEKTGFSRPTIDKRLQILRTVSGEALIRLKLEIPESEEIIWVEPYSGKPVLIHPKIIQLWKQEAAVSARPSSERKNTVKQGAISEKIGSIAPSEELQQQLSKQEQGNQRGENEL